MKAKYNRTLGPRLSLYFFVSPCPVRFAEYAFEGLTRGTTWRVLHYYHRVHALALGIDAFVDPPAYLLPGYGIRLLQNHGVQTSFTPLLVGNAKDCRFANRWMLTIMSFFLSTGERNPSSSAYPRSPVCTSHRQSLGRPIGPLIIAGDARLLGDVPHRRTVITKPRKHKNGGILHLLLITLDSCNQG